MTDSSQSVDRETRTTNALLGLILTTMLWLPLFGGTVLLINRL
ncbi:hypothetical protein [Haloterrigena salinisoli]